MKIIKIARQPNQMGKDMSNLTNTIQQTMATNSPLFQFLKNEKLKNANLPDNKIWGLHKLTVQKYPGMSEEQIVEEIKTTTQQNIASQQQQQQQPVPQQGMQMNPQMTVALRQAMQASNLSKQQAIPFLEALFTALGDVQISKVKEVIQSLQE